MLLQFESKQEALSKRDEIWLLAARKSNGFEQVRNWQRKKSLFCVTQCDTIAYLFTYVFKFNGQATGKLKFKYDKTKLKFTKIMAKYLENRRLRRLDFSVNKHNIFMQKIKNRKKVMTFVLKVLIYVLNRFV